MCALPSSLSLSLTRDFRPSSHGSSSTIRPVNSSRRRGTRYNVSRIPGCWCSPFLTCPADGPHGNQCARKPVSTRNIISLLTRDRHWHSIRVPIDREFRLRRGGRAHTLIVPRVNFPSKARCQVVVSWASGRMEGMIFEEDRSWRGVEGSGGDGEIYLNRRVPLLFVRRFVYDKK